MSKRSANGELLSLINVKRLCLESQPSDSICYDANKLDPALTDTPPTAYAYDQEDDDFTPNHTPASTVGVASSVTSNTTHRQKFPSDFKTLVCTWQGCARAFNRPARLRDHLNSHTNSRPWKCPYDGCDKDYIEDKHLKQHIKGTHTDERRHVCQWDGCGKSFVTGTRLKRHQAVHEGAERFRCPTCAQTFRKHETLNKHVRKDHHGLAPHECSAGDCGMAFDSKSALNRHKEREHGEIKYWCGECGLKAMVDGSEERVGFTTDVLLQAHIKCDHQECMFCDFKSSTQGQLETHIEMRHSGKSLEDRKTCYCPYNGCTRRFTRNSNLNTHIRTAHKGQRFICGELEISGPGLDSWSNSQGCGNTFASKVRLEDHIRYVHLGLDRTVITKQEPHQRTNVVDQISGVQARQKQIGSCPTCDKVFVRYADRSRHACHLAPSMPGVPRGDPASMLSNDQLGMDHAGTIPVDTNGDEMTHFDEHDEIFAADMDYGLAPDDWPEDEANILLLARASPELELMIDPTLTIDDEMS